MLRRFFVLPPSDRCLTLDEEMVGDAGMVEILQLFCARSNFHPDLLISRILTTPHVLCNEVVRMSFGKKMRIGMRGRGENEAELVGKRVTGIGWRRRGR
ncbi:hypothetical protein MUK42_16988 [Musa troglodytarum]|uniref:Uncharacterized protein n=1 Tax=Musa troglodytarum TaxID=320322 RepID=A0A9E7I8D9_9LILI|nr:hypothetical protein MUK42_16988 [Musa troglodytarum]